MNRYHDTSSSSEYAFGHGDSVTIWVEVLRARCFGQLFGSGLWVRSFGPSGVRSTRRAVAREDGMNHSMYGADRATHLKIVVIALICALAVAAVGIFAHVTSNIDLGTAALVKAGRPTSVSGDIPAIR